VNAQARLDASVGLTTAEARRRLAEFGENRIRNEGRARRAHASHCSNQEPDHSHPDGAAIVSLFLQNRTDAALILAIVQASGVLGFWQGYSATDAVAKLRALVETKARVIIFAYVVAAEVTKGRSSIATLVTCWLEAGAPSRAEWVMLNKAPDLAQAVQ
jgi:magnesium-transporting ATPase (P-type)